MTDSGFGTVDSSTVSSGTPMDMWNDTMESTTEMAWENITLSTAASWINGSTNSMDLNNSSGYLTPDVTLESNSTTGFVNATSWITSTVTSSSTAALTTSEPVPASGVAIAAAVFMVIFLLLALAGNVCCLIALRHKTLEKAVAIYTFLGNLCAVQFSDSILNMSLIIGAASSGGWPFGIFMCQFSAFILNLLNAESILALTLLALDRLLAVKWPETYSNMNRAKASFITGYAWLHGTLFTLFILAGVIPSEYLPDCYLCSVSSGTGYVYVVFFSLFCYILPLIIIISMYGVIVKVAVDEKPTVQNFNAELHYANRLGRRSKLWSELRRAKVIGALVIFWCVFQGPYLALQTVYLYGNSSYPSETDNVFSSDLKTAFTWMRFCYPWIVSVVVIVGFPEVREEFVSSVCHKNNTVNSGMGKQEMLAKPGVRTSWTSDASNSRPSTLGRSFQVPVLFATSGGLRLQIGNSKRDNDVDRAADYRQDGFHPDPRMKYDPTKSRYPPPLTPVPQGSDEETGGSWDLRTGPEEVAQEATLVSTISSSDPERTRSQSTSSSFQLSLTSRELKMHRSSSPKSPVGSPRNVLAETPPGSIPPSESSTPR
ncbi:uncharacterized protein [Asterias amurensis]|uniref:uncharacterized protein n=1 Tax=Asterias amurensis TaxID=7602 RepID=UPI003AB2D798